MREQRKVVTALFADVVGSTPLGESLDPEDFMDLVGGAVSRMVASVERFGGTIKDLAGDGLLALFGAPTAHEDDPERAVRAGFDVIEDIAAYAAETPLLRGREPLMVRVGIETGLVVLGQVGGGGRVEQGAMGDSVNTAARLQAAAQPGTVLVGPGTFERVGDLFEWEGPHLLTLKGKAEAVKAYGAVRPRPSPAIAPRRVAADLALVGRDRELLALRYTAQRLQTGTGGVLLVTGEPGIGKSRILAELRRTLQNGDGARENARVRWLEGRCRSYGENVPYAPFQDMLARWLEAEAADRSEPAWRRALEESIGADGKELVPLFEAFVPLALSEAEAERLRKLSPEDLQRQTREAFTALVRGLAAGPAVVAMEDIHWADASSLGLFEHVLPLAREVPVLFALSARSEAGPWTTVRGTAIGALGEGFVDLALEALPEQAGQEMLSALVGSAGLPEGARRRLLEAAGGNPFYLEEVVRSLIDRDTLTMGADGRWALQTDATIDVPDTVEQVLMSRVDALPRQAHEALTAAAVVGAQFGVSVIEAVTADPRVAEAIADLERADLVRPDAERPGEYRFKHALIQETAYRSLLKRRRRELHAATARALQGQFEGRTEEISGDLAHHLMEAGDFAGALHHGAIAGDRAVARFANAEAVASYRLAVDAGLALRRAGEAPPAADAISHVAESLGQVLELVGRHEEARDAFDLAIAETPKDQKVDLARLERRIGDTLQVEYRNDDALERYARADVMLDSVAPEERDEHWWGQWVDVRLERMAAFYWVSRAEDMAAVEREVRPVVERSATIEQRLRYSLLAKDLRLQQTHFLIDDETLTLAQAHLSAAEELGDLRQLSDAQFELAFCELFHGDFDAAEARLMESLVGADRVGDAVGRARRLAYLSLVARFEGREDATAERSNQLAEASREAAIDIYLPLVQANRAWLAWRSGEPAEARRLAEEAIEGWRTGATAYPFQWAAQWVLLAVSAAEGDVLGAIDHGAAMLAPEQQPLPEGLTAPLASGQQALAAGMADEAQHQLEEAVQWARTLGYL